MACSLALIMEVMRMQKKMIEEGKKRLKEGYPYAYVWNREEEFGEIGSIQIKMEQGGLVRVA